MDLEYNKILNEYYIKRYDKISKSTIKFSELVHF